tara:strand:+ start:76 stop:375 length:300 start_codon:yes stop_codon:yes gene_type:complete
MYVSYTKALIWYAFSLIILIIYALVSNSRGSLDYIQQNILISSSILFPLLFWYLLGKLINDSILFEKIAVALFLYINWYYWTYVITNNINNIYGSVNNN